MERTLEELTDQAGPVTEVDAVVVGGGMSGIRTTIALKRQGIRRIALLEKSEALGGVWHHNRYPGVGCDVPSPTYCYGFALNDWSRLFAPGDEIREYLQRTAAENDVLRHVRFRTELLDAAWDDYATKWICKTDNGTFRSQFLIVATGLFDVKAIPTISGAETFEGKIFHSTDWPSDFDATGKRIAVVGTGASAIQFVPRIQPQAQQLVILQRTPPWIVPKPDIRHKKSTKSRALLRQRALRMLIWAALELVVLTVRYPRLAILPEWLARKHLRESVADPEMRRLLTPDYKAGCKRLLLSNEWYPAVQAPNVDYVPSALREIRRGSVVADDGREFEVDTIIWGTGFQFGTRILDRIRGRSGQSLADRFEETPRTYLATTVVDCPNLFLVGGVHSGTVSVSIGCEAQAQYVASAVTTMRRNGVLAVEPKREIEQTWMQDRDANLAGAVFTTGCSTYYLNSKGENVAMFPGQALGMVRKLRVFDIDNYIVTKSSQLRPVVIAEELVTS